MKNVSCKHNGMRRELKNADFGIRLASCLSCRKVVAITIHSVKKWQTGNRYKKIVLERLEVK